MFFSENEVTEVTFEVTYCIYYVLSVTYWLLTAHGPGNSGNRFYVEQRFTIMPCTRNKRFIFKYIYCIYNYMNKLTPKQIKFATLIVSKGDRMSASDCAKEAGYSEKACKQQASNLQNPKMFPQVVDEIERLRREWQEKYKVSYSRHIKRLDDLSRGAEESGNWAAAVAAEKSRGQAAGLYIDRKEILTGSIDQLSKVEVEEKLKEIEKQFSINIEDADFVELPDKE